MYRLKFVDKWDKYFENLPPDIKVRMLKKLEKIKQGLPARHLKFGFPFFVEEVGQYRICYEEDEKNRIRIIQYAGNHKDYEKWCQSQK